MAGSGFPCILTLGDYRAIAPTHLATHYSLLATLLATHSLRRRSHLGDREERVGGVALGPKAFQAAFLAVDRYQHHDDAAALGLDRRDRLLDRAAGGNHVLHDRYANAHIFAFSLWGRERTLHGSLAAVRLLLVANDEGRDRRAGQMAGDGDCRGDRVRAQGRPADRVRFDLAQSLEHRSANQPGAFRVERDPARVEVVIAGLAGRQGELAGEIRALGNQRQQPGHLVAVQVPSSPRRVGARRLAASFPFPRARRKVAVHLVTTVTRTP